MSRLSKINGIGHNLVKCRKNCTGINNDPKNYVIPRCLYYESKIGKGCAVIGLNPGRSANKKPERNYYRDNGIDYDTVKAYWNDHGRNNDYYKKIAYLINDLKIQGAILWTELVKCENKLGVRILDTHTIRYCTNKFLRKEIEVISENSFIIALGQETYKALCFMFPDRKILGLPHPSSQGQEYKYLIKKNMHLKKKIKNEIIAFIRKRRVKDLLITTAHNKVYKP